MISVAPMIQYTDRHWRYLFRAISSHTTLYTEMTMDTALTYNPTNLDDFIGYSKGVEDPLVIQLGGSDPVSLSEAAYMCESYGDFEAINLNCKLTNTYLYNTHVHYTHINFIRLYLIYAIGGCPSNKAKKAGFGAELMLEPELVQRILYAMKRKVTHTDITVKCRIGVSGKETFDDLVEFILMLNSVGIKHVIIHARSCVLRGLSPAQNRSVPPLNYEWVHKLVLLFPDMKFTLNGGITTFDSAITQLGHNYELSPKPDFPANHAIGTTDGVHGVMIGREAYNNPFLFTQADSIFYNTKHSNNKFLTRRDILDYYLDYATDAQEKGVYGSNTCNILKPLHNFFAHTPTNREYKRALDHAIKMYTTTATGTAGNTVSESRHRSSYVANSTGTTSTPLGLEDVVWKVVEETVSAELLDRPLVR